ncbi:O-antigen ligase family protein [Oscillatoria sp. CS-180]|uniref:O-antigen ligase family protein n=1 Tax=Oscillatoria sp. CS-180 TaxID=3021720 RepID=UPI0023306657|nr:O-antigen ligase family protein [Oscillatoria sp. CS-180]MDB9525414.1 O-antigen ligase family protein [Oscillatoria sp. CS-180]
MSSLLILAALLYALFTLLPNSTTQMVTWPWVALWQAMLLLPIAWLLWQAWHKPLREFRLGNGFDALAGLAVLGMGISMLVAAFSQQAMWYGWAALGGLAALHGLMGWLTPARSRSLLTFQGYLAIAFILVSLGMWMTNAYLPELARLDALRAIGVEQSFNFAIVSLRNGFPLGHQNYVAGYLVLVLPLFVGLGLTDKTLRRWLWWSGLGLGLLTLYTTGSRAGVLALVALVLPTLLILLLGHYVPRRVAVPAGLLGLALLGTLAILNPRLQATLAGLQTGQITNSQVTYRLITTVTGWRMGWQRPWAGLGPGSVPLVYQQYRPAWAGREAELHHQLHSTPVQLWAELGIWGILLPLLAGVLLIYALWRHRTRLSTGIPASLMWSLVGGLWAYSVLSLVDYQLDVVAIAGVLVLYFAIILAQLRSPVASSAPGQNPRYRRSLVGAGVGITLAMGLWLLSIHRAWAASSQAFLELERENLSEFVTLLEQSQRLAPWESYYPFQLGWAVGDLSNSVEDSEVANSMQEDAIAWFQQGNAVSPFQEFGYSNLGWLQAQRQPEAAIVSFSQAAQLLPAKMGVFFGLGYSLLLNDQPNLAADAMALEMIRHPRIITSPVWTTEPFSTLYPSALTRLEELYGELLANADDPLLIPHLHQIRGATRWWLGDYSGAADDWDEYGTAIGQAVLSATRGNVPDIETLPNLPGKYVLQAWYDPVVRAESLAIAWVVQPEDSPVPNPPPSADQIQGLANSMAASETLEQWLKQNAPVVEARSERLGFGVFKRHDDGPNPFDYYVRFENVAIAKFFDELFLSPRLMPALDEALQPYRIGLIEATQQSAAD